jgi:DNA-binding SARP family transcriptional activator
VEVEEGRWRLRKARALLKLLALTPGHRLHREQAFETLWPERDPAAAANNLRQALFTARRALDSCGDDGARRLGMSHEVLTLETRGLRIDVDEFEQAAQRAERIRSLDGYRAALDLYGGDLLPEDRFEAWTSVRRQSLRDRHLSLLIGIAALHEQEGDYAEAVTALQVALGQEPLHEEAHRQLMSVYVRSGRRQRALEQFHLLRDALQTEYADEPDDETRLLYRQILTRSRGQRCLEAAGQPLLPAHELRRPRARAARPPRAGAAPPAGEPHGSRRVREDPAGSGRRRSAGQRA